MAVSQARLNRYRADLDAIGDAAYSFVDEFIRATMASNPGMTVAALRDEAIDAIDSSLYAFGDQASELALDLFEEIVVDGYGLDADTVIEDAIDPEMIEGGVRYSARQLVEGDTEAFARDVADLSRYYVKRSAMENMVRNCDRNDLRYARVPSGRETCAFCFMLSSRGFVYRSEQTAGHAHAYHENCDCVIVPGFKGLDPGDQVEGYDPDGMLERWHECQATACSDSDFRDEWKSMGRKDRAKYKGGSDEERYGRFVNAKAMREVEARDWRWLYTGEIPSYSKEVGAEPNIDELNTAGRLASNGFRLRFRKTRDTEGLKTSDVYIVGSSSQSEWDFKGPDGNGAQTVFHQFEEAAGQSRCVVIDFAKAGDKYLDKDYAEGRVRKFIRYHYKVKSGVGKGDEWTFNEAIVIFKDESIKRIAR